MDRLFWLFVQWVHAHHLEFMALLMIITGLLWLLGMDTTGLGIPYGMKE